MLVRISLTKDKAIEKAYTDWIKAFHMALEPQKHSDVFALHKTRIIEYPWAMVTTPPNGKILDIGSNEQFPVALMEMGHDVCMQYTDVDYFRFGTLTEKPISNWEAILQRYRNRCSVYYCYPKDFAFADNYFDTIYCISTIEHVKPEDIEDWYKGIWRVLKPGGTACFTIDYYLDGAKADPNNCFSGGYAHDMLKVLTNCGLHDFIQNDEECPWTEGFSVEKIFADKDVAQPSFKEYGRIAVYGFTLHKPIEAKDSTWTFQAKAEVIKAT